MKSLLKIIWCGFFILPILYGCSDNVFSTIEELGIGEEIEIKHPPDTDTRSLAIRRAEGFLKSECVMETNAHWGRSGVITEAFPVYLDGIEEVSYYECKVEIGGNDAGYILVNINETDLPFPQYNIEGQTPSEDLAREADIPLGNLQVFRHNWFEMFAERDGVPVIARGYNRRGTFMKKSDIDQQKFSHFRWDFRERLHTAGRVNPLFDKQLLSQVHNKDSLIADLLDKHPEEQLAKTKKSKWTSDELNHTFATGWHLPQWTQVRNDLGYWTGCGPLAIMMLYAFHKQFEGKDRLFGTDFDLNADIPTPYGAFNASSWMASYNERIQDIVYDIGHDCNAHYGIDNTSTSLNDLENHGDEYGDQLGYDVHLDMDFGGDFTKGKKALNEIRRDRPCIVRFDSDMNGFSDHAGCIEGVKYLERKYLFFWLNWEMWYLINFGWGDVRQWICVDAQYTSSTPDRTNSGNLYMQFR